MIVHRRLRVVSITIPSDRERETRCTSRSGHGVLIFFLLFSLKKRNGRWLTVRHPGEARRIRGEEEWVQRIKINRKVNWALFVQPAPGRTGKSLSCLDRCSDQFPTAMEGRQLVGCLGTWTSGRLIVAVFLGKCDGFWPQLKLVKFFFLNRINGL